MRPRKPDSTRAVRLVVEVRTPEEARVVKTAKKICIDWDMDLRQFVLGALEMRIAHEEKHGHG